ncbi:hypothetical protein BLNAU_10514 [Blattamonas nauphoetae]|uniref:Uncharacterized protein n=1 Tax=Blattamonas nauphoetae TaxID=2049346 RepID=A0ABQ9XRV4_9EUKA|nr:hypothetical protein BLNAU_10514 [Blattamonas nauphoetae]
MWRLTQSCVKQAANRTDVCDICEVWDRARCATIPTLTKKQLARLVHRHREEAINQQMQQKLDISSLADSECVCVLDYKENLKVPFSKSEKGQNFFNMAPITVLTMCCYKKVDAYFSDVNVLKHWSDGGSHITDGIDTLVKFSTRVLKLKVKCSTVPLNKAPALLGEVFKCIEYLQARYDFPQNRSDRHPVAKIDEHDLEVESGASCGGSDSDNGLTQEDLE